MSYRPARLTNSSAVITWPGSARSTQPRFSWRALASSSTTYFESVSSSSARAWATFSYAAYFASLR